MKNDINGLPKKLKISSVESDGSFKELSTMEWDGDKWFIRGKHSEAVKQIIGDRGKRFGGKLYTLRDRNFFLPMLHGYSNFAVDVIETEEGYDEW